MRPAWAGRARGLPTPGGAPVDYTPFMPRLNARVLRVVLAAAARAYIMNRAARLGAAVAYYAIFALTPLLLLVVVVAGYFLGRDEVRAQLLTTTQQALGPEVRLLLSSVLGSSLHSASSLAASVTGLLLFFFGSTNLVLQLKEALDVLWGVRPPPVTSVGKIIRNYILAFLGVLLFGLLIMIFIAGSTYLSVIAAYLSGRFGGGAFWLRFGTLVLSVSLFTPVFALVYKYVPDVRLTWRDVWLGAFVTGTLFSVGQLLVGVYIAHFTVANAFGAASSLVLLLAWVYYSTQIVFFGAEITWAYATLEHAPTRRQSHPGTGADHHDPLRAVTGAEPPGSRARQTRTQRPRPAGEIVTRAVLALLALPALPLVWLLQWLAGRRRP